MMIGLGFFIYPKSNVAMLFSATDCCTIKTTKTDCCSSHKKEKHTPQQGHCSSDCATCHAPVVSMGIVQTEKDFIAKEKKEIANHMVVDFYLHFLPPNPLKEIWQPPKIS